MTTNTLGVCLPVSLLASAITNNVPARQALESPPWTANIAANASTGVELGWLSLPAPAAGNFNCGPGGTQDWTVEPLTIFGINHA